ncbi:MAG: TIGR00266 family protein [Candidatus Micrarchaeaceae archaeon]
MDYEIIGSSMQSLRISLQNGEKIYSDSGKLLSKTETVKMTPRVVGGIIGVIERKMTGATGLLTEFLSTGDDDVVSVAGVFPGKIKAITLTDGQEFIAEHYAFLAAEDTVKFTMQTVSLGAAFFGGAGLILQKFVGPGKVFIHTVGDTIEHVLDGSRRLEVDPGHIAGFDASLQYKIRFVDNIRTAMFGGVGLFLATFSGTGTVIMHSISRFKMSSEIYLSGLAQNPPKH